MKRTEEKMIITAIGTVVLASCLLNACKNNGAGNKDDLTVTPTVVEEVTPSKEPNLQPTIGPITVTEEPTAEPTEVPTKEPTPEVTATPKPSKITFQTNDYTYKINDKEDETIPLINLEMDDLVVTVQDNEAASQKINDFLQKNKEDMVAMAKEQAEYAKGDYDCQSEESHEYWYGYSITSSYYIERSDDSCFSLLRNSSYDLGGPHPNNECLVYNFNPETGDMLTLEDVADDMTAFRELVNQKLLEGCKEFDKERLSEGGEYEEGDTILLPGYEENIPKILQEGTWYFNDQGLVIIVNEQIVSSHGYGSFDVTIPYSELKFVKEKFTK